MCATRHFLVVAARLPLAQHLDTLGIGDGGLVRFCVWQGAGAGGSSHALEDPSNWSYATATEIYVGLQGTGLLRWVGGTLNANSITLGPDGAFATGSTQDYAGGLHCPNGGTVTAEPGAEVSLSSMFCIEPDADFCKDGEGTLIISGFQEHGIGSCFEILGGTVDMNSDASPTGLMNDAYLSILIADATLSFGCNQHLDTLTIEEGELVRFTGANVVVVKNLVMNGVPLGPTTLTPEPATLALLVVGALGVLLRRHRTWAGMLARGRAGARLL